MLRYSVITFLVFIFSISMIQPSSFSQGDQAEINTLRGLKAIGVSVQDVDSDAKADGLNNQTLLKSINNKLKKAGIKVMTSQELGTSLGQPQLVLNVNTTKQPGPIYLFTATLDFNQIVLLQRNSRLSAVSPTWSVLTTGGALPEDLAKNVKAAVDPMLDSFIADYKKANPK